MKRFARYAAAAAALAAATTLASLPADLPPGLSASQLGYCTARECHDGSASKLGYSTAKECHDGSGCGSAPTLLTCLDCCLDHCNYNGFLSGCSALCSGDGEKATAGIIEASRVLRKDWSPQSSMAIEVLIACSMSSNADVSRLAWRVAGEFPPALAALKHSGRPA